VDGNCGADGVGGGINPSSLSALIVHGQPLLPGVKTCCRSGPAFQ
jgi:hypothetical protein